jgi:hypothetical protein
MLAETAVLREQLRGRRLRYIDAHVPAGIVTP